jgi:hypothetical protein
MNRYINFPFWAVMGLFIALSCSEDEKSPLESDPAVPKQVTVRSVERLPGAVSLTYDIPDDPNFFYVRAECEVKGQIREAKTSAYGNTLTIEGFPDTSAYMVKLYSVSRSEVASAPVQQEVRPLAPAYLEAFKSLDLFADFGGATCLYSNPSGADLVIMMSYVDSTGTWINSQTAYTSQKEGSLSQRDMDTVPTWFGVSIRDRWNNTTDTLTKLLTPIFEEEADKSLFRLITLPTDAGNSWGWVQQNLWDGSVAEGRGWVSTTVSPLPIHITVDLGATYQFSRLTYWNRESSDWFFDREAVLQMEIWGSNNPNLDGSFDESWTLLTTTPKISKPSGLGYGQLNAEDREAGLAGNESNFPSGTPSCRYIRFKILETGNMGLEVTFMEFSIWGAKVN